MHVLFLAFLSFKFIAKVYYTVYINISHFTEEDTSPNTKQLSFPCLCGGDQLQISSGLDRSTLRWNLQSYQGILRNFGISMWDSIFTIVSISICMLALGICLFASRKVRNCLVHHATVLLSVALYTQLYMSRWIFLLLNLRTITLTMLASRRPNSFLGLDIQLVGNW